MQPAGSSVLVRRRRVVLAGAIACVLLAVLAVLLVVGRGDGSSRTDLGDQSDPGSVGAAVGAAIGGGRAGPPAESSVTCAAETRGSYGQGLDSLVYTARLRWQGVPAVALAYRVTGAGDAGLDHRVFVVSTAGCQLLVAQSL